MRSVPFERARPPKIRLYQRPQPISFSIRKRRFRAGMDISRKALPGENEADIAGRAPRILEHLSLEVEAELPEVIVPEFVNEFGAAFQRCFLIGLRVVDPWAAIAAHRIWKTIELHFPLSALGRMADQRHHDSHQLLGRPLERFVKLLHHRLSLFLILLHMSQFFGCLRPRLPHPSSVAGTAVHRGATPATAHNPYKALAVVAVRISAFRLSAAIRPSMPSFFRMVANSERRVATSLIAPSR